MGMGLIFIDLCIYSDWFCSELCFYLWTTFMKLTPAAFSRSGLRAVVVSSTNNRSPNMILKHGLVSDFIKSCSKDLQYIRLYQYLNIIKKHIFCCCYFKKLPIGNHRTLQWIYCSMKLRALISLSWATSHGPKSHGGMALKVKQVCVVKTCFGSLICWHS